VRIQVEFDRLGIFPWDQPRSYYSIEETPHNTKHDPRSICQCARRRDSSRLLTASLMTEVKLSWQTQSSQSSQSVSQRRAGTINGARAIYLFKIPKWQEKQEKCRS
jgi:hypothetical protein